MFDLWKVLDLCIYMVLLRNIPMYVMVLRWCNKLGCSVSFWNGFMRSFCLKSNFV